MSRQLIDLSVPVLDGPSEATPVEVTVLDHKAAPADLGLRPEDCPEGEAISNETVTLTTHPGTHMDAPLHCGLHSGGQAAAVDGIPLDWCFAPGVRLDLRPIPVGAGITAGDIEDALAKIPHELRPGDIALIWTGADRPWGTEACRSEFAGMTRESTAYLVEHGVKVIGIDAWGSTGRSPRCWATTGRPTTSGCSHRGLLPGQARRARCGLDAGGRGRRLDLIRAEPGPVRAPVPVPVVPGTAQPAAARVSGAHSRSASPAASRPR